MTDKTLAEQVIYPETYWNAPLDNHGVTVPGRFFPGPCIPISALLARRDELKAEKGRTYNEANYALIMELKSALEDKGDAKG